MDIDMTALRALEHEKDISFDVVVEAIESALLSAYHKTHGARSQARVELDRKTGHVTVWARDRLDDEPAEEPVAVPADESAEATDADGAVRVPLPSRPPRPRSRGTARSSTTPPRTSAGSPPPSRASSSCSGCATPRTSRSTASSPARSATSCPASSSRAAGPAT